jgi:replication-associated recombination protein RarA
MIDYQSSILLLPSDYRPQTPDDFIGPAARIALLFDRILASAMPVQAPIKLLLYGEPGTGKSSLANFICQRLGCNKWTITKLNGTQVKVEAVEELAARLRYKELFGGYRFIWIDEADKIPLVAQVRFLSLLDDLPKQTAVVCTCNSDLNELEKRFQSRFQAFDVAGPGADTLTNFLTSGWSVPAAVAKEIAVFANGNVRQALLDAQSYLQNAA